MRNLLAADFARLKRDKFFWLSVAAMLIFTVYMIVNRYSPDYLDDLDYFSHWHYYYFNAIEAIELLCALFIALYIGKDLDSKAIRNKAIAGHSKINIYLSYLITSATGGAVIYIAMLIGGLVAIPLFGVHIESRINIAAYILIGFVSTLSISAVYTFVAAISGSRVKALIISIVIAFAAFFIFAIINTALWQPEFSDHHYSFNGVEWTEVIGEIPNPLYVSGALRTFLQYISEIFPTGNIFLLMNNYTVMVVNPIREIALSLLFTIATVIGGIFAFCKKDMK